MNYLFQRPLVFTCFFFCISIFNIGCVDLSGAKYHPHKKIPASFPASYQTPNSKINPYQGQVYTMLGGLGIFSTGMKELSATVEEQLHISAPSGMWYQAGQVTRAVSHYPNQSSSSPVILVGHSLGANEQIKVARSLSKKGIPVALLVTVDAVSQTRVPPNVKHAMNFYKSGYVPMFSGLKLRAVDPTKTKIDNIDVTTLKGVSVNHFTIDKNPVVQAMILQEIKKVTRHANRAKI